MHREQIEVPLSRLLPGRRNPRRVKPTRESHKRLVALIRSQGLLQPLVVRPAEGSSPATGDCSLSARFIGAMVTLRSRAFCAR